MNDRRLELLLVINDLIFETKIRTTAQSLGAAVKVVRNAAQLEEQLRETQLRLVMVDLNTAGDPIEAVRAAAEHEACPHVLAFVSHVDAALSDSAAQAGAHEVLPRSRFTIRLPEILRRFAS
jgi:DNA-binding NarL/FixJ family response regulator